MTSGYFSLKFSGAVRLVLSFILLGLTQVILAQSDVIISQYIETNSGTTPKGIEVFNVSGATINFSAANALQVQQGTNGNNCNTLITIASGSLAANEVWVIGSSDLTVYANANGTDLSGTSSYNFSFNGDDAISITLGGVIQDMFGTCGSDPGSQWVSSGVSTRNMNISISNGICDGDIDGWTNPDPRFDYTDTGSNMTGFGNAPAPCGGVACTPVHTISGIAPLSGPVGTRVTITGTGFSTAATATVSGIAATVTYIDATSLQVTIPPGATDGPIIISEFSCEEISADVFSILSQANCGASVPAGFSGDIIITGVYDDSDGSCHYIQLLNPTTAPINLAGYVIGADNNLATATDPVITTGFNGGSISLSGILPAASFYMLRSSGSAANCASCPSVITDAAFNSFGFNANDRLVLVNSGVAIDVWQNFGQGTLYGSGYMYTRSLTAIAPSTSFNIADWQSNGNEDCINFQFPQSSPATISPNPLDVNACTLDMTITASPAAAGSMSYQWHYNDGIAAGWTSLLGLPGLTVTGAATDHLIVTGPTIADISGHQFYCLATETPGCQKYSDAAQYIATPEPYFRSAISGDWNSLSTWEMSPDGVSNWLPSCKVPDDKIATSTSISPGHNVIISEVIGQSPDARIDALVIAATASLELQPDAELDIYDSGAAADMIVEGTWRDRAQSGFGNGLNFEATAYWELGTNGTIIKTNSSALSNYRDQYAGGMSTIPSSGHWYYLYNGDGSVSTSTTNMWYPNLYMESSLGNHDFVSAIETFTGGSGGFATVKGDLSLGVNGGNVTMVLNNFNLNVMPIWGDLIIAVGSTLTTETYRSLTGQAETSQFGISYREGRGIAVAGDLYLDGLLDLAHSPLTSLGVLELNGSSPQSITGSTPALMNHLKLNNTQGFSLVGQDLEVVYMLDLVAGVMTVDPSSLLHLTIECLNSGGNAGSFIDGRLRKTGLRSSYAHTYPVGDIVGGTLYFQPAALHPFTDYGQAIFDVEYHHENFNIPANYPINGFLGHYSYNPPSVELTAIGTCSYWDIDRVSVAPNAPDLRVGLSWDLANCGFTISDPSLLNVAHFDAVSELWEDAPDNPGTSYSPNLPPYTTGWVWTTDVVSSFSPFTIGQNDTQFNVLPIELLDFRAQRQAEQVVIEWTTASEINNDYFTLERSTDAQLFNAIGHISGAGDSHHELHYRHDDLTPLLGTNYYRLRQTDYDGQESLSSVVMVEGLDLGSAIIVTEVGLSHQGLRMQLNPIGTSLEIKIFDLSGRLITGQNVPAGQVEIDLPMQLNAGLYILQLSSGEQAKIIKLQLTD